MRRNILALIFALATAGTAMADRLRLVSTTSTQNSGLYDFILPIFTAETGITVEVIPVGTGQAIRIAQNGDADILLVHHRPSEEQFMTAGYGQERFDVMYNDFILVGPAGLDLQGRTDLDGALQQLSLGAWPFISRGDDSGTHKKERELWRNLGLVPMGRWYREIGAGMGAALNMASALDGFTLTDRGTWLSFGNKGALDIQVAGDERLRNPYGLIIVNAARFAHINLPAAQRFAHWLTGPRGQSLIGQFRVDGMQLFCPIADIKKDIATTPCPADQSHQSKG